MDGAVKRNQRAAVIARGVRGVRGVRDSTAAANNAATGAAAALFTFNQLGCTTRHLG